ncbi:hypothetical protein PCASD_14760 [Puccinia coronata f. sp. avenae]|uniref:Integrase catalytic domain-containing protein n=1 Tax=Puccinia coronata f. sp. avenae TaxID=200324 RepID=A0A2N5UAZ6_9BASI|nr:hypothetical protein PCASD_14760 [Puccinia coronata f. sp. avenae]
MADLVLIEKVKGAHVVNIDDGIQFTCTMASGVLKITSHIGPVTASFEAISLAMHSAPTTPFQTWHNRLGHACIACIRLAIPGKKMEVFGSCDPCMKGKLSRIPFRSHFNPTTAPLQVIHGNIVGPIAPLTNSGKCYFLTLVNQHTGYISVTLLNQNLDAMSAFLIFKTFFENQTGHSIKKLITDGGGKFVNKSLTSSLDSFGIQHNMSPPYTLQHNGIAERANKTIINMARCMLSQSNLAKEWWGEAVCMAMAVTNCLPSACWGKVSPIQLFFGKKPNFNVFQPFGCKTWMIKPKHLRGSKFYSVSWDGIVIGYSNNYSAYKVIRLPDKSIIETKHAYFDESVFPSMGALDPSVDHSPHSGLPDFNSAALFPFQEEESLLFQDEEPLFEQEEDRMDLEEDEEQGHEVTPITEVEEKTPSHDSDPPAPRRRLIIHGPRHPTLVESSISSGNILCYPRRPAVAFTAHTVEPRNHLQAINSVDKEEWVKAEKKEIDNMISHNVWTEVPARPNVFTIPSTWAYKKKLGENNGVIEFKARICAQGFCQTHGLNFDLNQLLIHQLDVKSAFLTCDLEEKVYLTPPTGYCTGSNIHLALNKAIYGLKQASLAWYNRLRSFLVKIGFSVSVANPCVFWRAKDLTWVFAHVDDLIIFSKQPTVFVEQISSEFQIKYMGEASFLLGMKLDCVKNGLVFHQNQYIKQKLTEFNLAQFPPLSCPINPQSHLQGATPDEISHKLSQFLERPGILHYRAAVQVFCYLHNTKDLGLLFGDEQSKPLIFSVDTDWGNCPVNTQRPHTGYLATLNHHIISWKLSKQCTVLLSSTEAEYKALSDAGKEASWLINLCQEIFSDSPIKTATIEIDNRGAIDLAGSQVSQNGFRTKHMDL